MNLASQKSRVALICAILAIATFAAFVQTLRCDFIIYDDEDHVTKNPHVYTGLTMENIKWAFTTGYWANWQPIVWISHMVNCQLFKLNPFYHHLTNLLLHIADTVLLFLVFYLLTTALWQSAFVAALFALHPLHVESVAWVAERKDVLSTLFCLLAFAAYWRYTKQKSVGFFFLTLLLFVLGLMSKPMLVTFPFILLLLDYWPLNRFSSLLQPDSRKTFYKLVIEKIPFFAFSAASCVITYIVQKNAGAISNIRQLPFDIRVVNSLVSYFRYIRKMFVPTKLAILYPYTGDLPPVYVAVIIAVALLTVTILFLRLAKNHKYLLTGWFWYLGTLVPVIGLVQVGAQTHADRYTYISLIGLFIIIAWGANDLLKNYRHRTQLLAVAAVAALSALALCTVHQVGYWKNTITIFEHTAAVTNKNARAHAILGLVYGQKQFLQAVDHYKSALAIEPDFALAITNLGCVYAKTGFPEKAVEMHKKAIELVPGFAMAHYNLASAYGKLNRHADAIAEYKKALELNPDIVEAHYGLGIAYANSRLYEQAEQEFKKTLKLNPEYAQGHYSLALLYADTGRKDLALTQYKTLKSLDPNSAAQLYTIITK
jgi:tetratricopeptide (TPR) repeat protein